MPNPSNLRWLDQTQGLRQSSRVLHQAGVCDFGVPVFAEDSPESNSWCGNADGLSTYTRRLLYVGREASQQRWLVLASLPRPAALAIELRCSTL